MRIGLHTWGTEGDVRPFFALAHELATRGHAVQLDYTSVEGREYGSLAAACGVDARDVAGSYFRENREAIQESLRRALALKNVIAETSLMLETMLDPVADTLFTSAEELCANSDVIVGHFMMHPIFTAALKHRRPHVLVAFSPVFPSGDFPPPGLPSWGRLANSLAWKLAFAGLNRTMVPRVNRLRDRHGVTRVESMLGRSVETYSVALTAVSPSLLPRPSDWTPGRHVTGFLRLPERAEPKALDAELESFLGSGKAPVFLSFGSMQEMNAADGRESLRLMLTAVKLAGARAIVQAPEALIGTAPRSENVSFVSGLPHRHVFPHCSVVVHHGGSGTTHAAVSAGKPSIIVPHGADQPFWGRTLERLKIAPRMIWRRHLTAERLAAHIRHVLAHPEMEGRARSLARRINEERGAATAADLIERVGSGQLGAGEAAPGFTAARC